MSTEETEKVVGQLRAGIDSIPARVPPGLARRAYGQYRRRRAATRTVAAAGTAAAAAVAIVLVATSTPQPAAPTAGPASRAHAVNTTVNSKLAHLASFITASDGSLPGNASLIIRNQSGQGGPVEITYNLYADSGAYYCVDTEKALTAAVADHDNLAFGAIREVAVARYAATGDLATAREQMVNAVGGTDYYDSLAEQRAIWAKGAATRAELAQMKGIKGQKLKAFMTMPTGKTLQEDIDSNIWDDSFAALSQGAGSPQVRAGVLRLLSTVPEVTVADSTTGGRPTLTLTARFAGEGSEVLTINAKTGMPISYASNLPGTKPVVDTFQVSRVAMADVEAGRF
jgi:hypothetical protein